MDVSPSAPTGAPTGPPPPDRADALAKTAGLLIASGKGILAADESITTMSARLTAAGVTPTPRSRRDYRALLLTAPDLHRCISGIILCEETLRQHLADDTPFPQACTDRGILPGIKVDTGAKPLANSPEETVTEGLDGLRQRLAEFAELGARFAKWRGVIRIDESLPTRACVVANTHALARYAALCQEAGIVPIIEPEVLMTGDHMIERSVTTAEEVLRTLFAALAEQGVALDGVVLKPSMILPGRDCPQQATVSQVAQTTVRVMRRCVPAAVPGIAFLSGGQDPSTATAHLQAMNTLGTQPWALTFSFGRALVSPALTAWHGDPAQVTTAQQTLLHRARCNAAAAVGCYSPDLEPVAV
ncbi:fructose-bisphosphate aldolase class I [soil metagenome]